MTYDTSSLEALEARRQVLDAELRAEVLSARAKGASWQAIATALGCSKQNVHKKYGPPSSKVKCDKCTTPGQYALFHEPQEVDAPSRASTP